MQSVRLLGLAVAILLPAVSPLPSHGQVQPVGVVTTLTGRADVTRAALSQPLILKFKDDVFERDRIATAEKSIVRVLLGGKAIVTVRELSTLTITEEPGRATIDLASGKIGVAVVKQRMRPGETLEIRTPNAVAAVRGTVFVVETHQVGTSQASGGGPAGSFVTTVDVKPPQDPQAAPDIVQVTVGGQTRDVPGGSGINAIGNTLGQLRAWNPTTFVTGLAPGTGGPSAGAATEGPIESGMSQAGALALVISPGPANQLMGPLPGGPIGTVPPPPNNGTTGKTGEEIKQGTVEVKPSTPITPVPPPPPPSSSSGLVNGGFETGALGPWTLTGTGQGAGIVATPGSGGVISALGPTNPPAGGSMGLLSTGGTFNNNAVANISSKLTQSFNVTGGKLYTILASVSFYSNEHPSQNAVYNDFWQIGVRNPGQNEGTVLKQENRNDVFVAGSTATNTSTALASAGGFQTNGPFAYGVTGFRDFSLQWTPSASGVGDLFLLVSDVTDSAVDSAILFDNIMVLEDPPLFFLQAGQSLTPTTGAPLLQLTGTPTTFDSLLAIGTGGRATLTGPLLRAIDSDLTVSFSLLSVFQGGSLTSSSREPLAFLSGGTHSFGGVGVPMFDLSGTTRAADPETGLTLGADRPLQHAGPLLETSNATVSAHRAVRVDSALLEASAPLLALTNGSKLTTAADTVQLSYQAKVTSLGSLVKLDRSSLVVARGAALDVAGGSMLRVTGDLFSLTNGSTLSVLNGPLLSLSGGSILNVNGALIGFGGIGGNLVSISNSFCPCTTIGGIPVSLAGGALASNVSIAGAIKNGNLGTVNLAPNTALIRVDGAGTKVSIGGL